MNNEEDQWSDWLITYHVKHHETKQEQLVSTLVIAPNRKLATKLAAEKVHKTFASGSVVIQIHTLLCGDGKPMSLITD